MILQRLGARAGAAALTSLGVLLLVFLALRMVPGDPVELMLGESASAASRQQLRSALDLDRPLPAQLAHFANGLAHGELGNSITRHKPVTSLIAQAFPYTLLLAIAASLIANAIGVPLGVLSASHARARRGHAIFAFSIALVSVPVFWLGPLLVVLFALRWPWLPVSSFREWSGIVLPALTMGLALAGHLIQTTRAAVLETLGADFIRTAAAKGASQWQILFRHALPVAAVPVITVSALQFGHLLAGAVIIETIFDWPGIGRLLYDAILQRDYPTVQGVVLVITLVYVTINMLTDLINERFSFS